MSGLKKLISEIFFPPDFTCDICGIETFGTNICNSCLKTISFNDGNVCPVCGRKTTRPEICIECKARAPLFVKAVSPLVYDGGTLKLIAKYKNGGAYLKEHFADLITAKLEYFPKFDCIVYVPMTKKAERKREYNQAKILAESISKRINVPVIKNALIKTKDTAEQKSLSFKERKQNLSNCFKVENHAELKDKDVLLVDDVFTTGATAEAITEKLLKAGVKHVYFATVASVEYKPHIKNEKDR